MSHFNETPVFITLKLSLLKPLRRHEKLRSGMAFCGIEYWYAMHSDGRAGQGIPIAGRRYIAKFATMIDKNSFRGSLGANPNIYVSDYILNKNIASDYKSYRYFLRFG